MNHFQNIECSTPYKVPTNILLNVEYFKNSQQNIKKRNQHNEASSPVFKDNKFLEIMENTYKRDFLKEISTHSELLVYDWSNGGEVDLVVDDIERIGMFRI